MPWRHEPQFSGYAARKPTTGCIGDTIALRDEPGIEGEALLRPMVRGGQLVEEEMALAEGARERVTDSLARLPEALKRLEAGHGDYPVELSPALECLRSTTRNAI
uniref:hypothetical protein n=1 Tax=uncultured Halomonas sp. TaxID=173971 RepID=UPI002636C8B6|nr:hypothetical protein [uncultured Halomonas sp.]